MADGQMPDELLVELDELSEAWYDARMSANLAYEHWRATPGLEAYAVYRAEQDRADAAQDALAEWVLTRRRAA